jgi:hypothetical protein
VKNISTIDNIFDLYGIKVDDTGRPISSKLKKKREFYLNCNNKKIWVKSPKKEIKKRVYKPRSLHQVEKIKLVNGWNINSFIKHFGIAYPCARCVKRGKKKIWLVRKQGPKEGKSMFMTITFRDRIYSKEIAEGYKYRFLKDLRANTPFEYCCVPEPHKSGAIHFHLLIAFDEDISLKEFKRRISRLNLSLRGIGFIDVEWTYGSPESVAYYLTQYLTAEMLDSLQGKSITYSKGVPRVANSRFSFWSPSQSKVENWGWRQYWDNMEKFIPPLLNCRTTVVREYFDNIVCKYKSDRFELLELCRSKNLEGMYDYVIKGIKEQILYVPSYLSASETRQLLLNVNQICRDSIEFENQLNGVPF